ncbi:MAG: SprT-like domain-containing protein [Gammaproteobacteria bacterium]|jgi:SprT protein|nr:SprT-like domain-containing protein [Gammaproteobacteria bacterium]
MTGRGSGAEIYVTPIDEAQRRLVTAETLRWIDMAAAAYGRKFPALPVLFDLRGRMAGMYRVCGEHRIIRYNPWLFAKYPGDGIEVTVPHEVAHYVTDLLHGFHRIRPHGREWCEVMRLFGVDPSGAMRHRLDLSGIPLRRQRRHLYRCECRTHQLSGVRHGRVQRETAKYVCRRCGTDLEHVPPDQSSRAASSSQRR